METLSSFFLAQVDASTLITLMLTSVFTSLVSALVGFGGGVLLLTVMATLISPADLIAVHGLVQMGSNASRICAYRRDLSLSFTRIFLIGGLAGAMAAALVVSQLPPSLLLTSVAIFVLISAWLPTGIPIRETPRQIFCTGAGLTFLSLFVGATGPMMASVLRGLNYAKATFVGTMAVCLLGQNLLKTAVFGSLGFNPLQWMPVVLAMILAGITGTWIGSRLLGRLNEARFGLVLKWTMTLIALKLLWQSLMP
ncbi:sulfite exporter TauE/SafE family protein [Marinobacterium rhizophilum]|uniref:Probable membrane transporter protein n=1 Tax=Marinobacterium rhizophilum TaxID=420402 RepID=A0ABY5HHT2_9GAMM|nr:sulfite exporter TauE/SafE family protein [Marinobacterium rhizophilum]UTW11392.1 sulfite exporter TauE/SafE family protein [Marinobacterium rhizophilum]